jgi:TonB dependent receptor
MLLQGIEPVKLTFKNFSAYAQDRWRVSARLSLVYGLRWELNPAPTGRDGTELFTLNGIDDLTTTTLAPAGTPLYQTTYNNFAPRVGASYRLRQSVGRETVLRGGFGVFYDLGAAQGPSSSNFPFSRNVTLSAGTAYPLSAGQVTPPPAPSFQPPYPTLMNVTDPNVKLGYVLQHSVTLEQSVGSGQTISAAYVGAFGRRLLKYSRVFAPTPRFVSGAVIDIATNGATSDYHAMQLQFQRRFSRGLQALASYTWSHSIDTDSGDSNTPVPPLNRVPANIDRGPSTFDVRHSFLGAVTYDIPAPHSGDWMRRVFGDFGIDTSFRVQSAPPVNVFSSRNIGFGNYNFRPDRVPDVPLYIDDSTAPGGRRINPNAFDAVTPQAQSRIGTLGRNSLRGFPFSQIDLALRRRFRLNEEANLQFRAEIFNAFNHPNFGNPVTNLTSNLFGQSTAMLARNLTAGSGGAGTLSPLYQAGGPRSIQLALKLQF